MSLADLAQLTLKRAQLLTLREGRDCLFEGGPRNESRRPVVKMVVNSYEALGTTKRSQNISSAGSRIFHMF